jgi:hypothetical protein
MFLSDISVSPIEAIEGLGTRISHVQKTSFYTRGKKLKHSCLKLLK